MKNKCKLCGLYAEKKFGLYLFCGLDCAYKYAKDKQEKRRKNEAVERKRSDRARLLKLKTRSEWMKTAQTVFNQYIRLRDAGLPCISCGRPNDGSHQRHASHYKSRGAFPELAFNPLNCHASCSQCNNFLSGNLVPYRVNLISKIGKTKVEWLESKHEPLKLSIPEIKELIATYRAKIKQLKSA